MATLKTPSELKAVRLKIYNKKVTDRSLFPHARGRRLVASSGNRQREFNEFVDLYFSQHVSKTPGWGETKQPTKLTKNSDGYKAFNKFAMTNYGSSVIREMVYNRKKYVKEDFVIMENTKYGANAGYGAMTLPKNFPKASGRFSLKGQKIYDLAIIYHEFAHTMVFRDGKSKNISISIQNERFAVLRFENPVRLKKGFEPRYTYRLLNNAGSVIKTVNITTGEIRTGRWTISKYDPTILVKDIHKDAL